MSDMSAEPLPDPAHPLARDLFHEIMLTLRRALPPPATDDPAERVERDEAALTAVASLLPATAMEGRLAAQAVAADAWAMECLRLGHDRYREFDIARKCKAQASSMMREAKSALRELARLQAARAKRDANPEAAGQAEWVEHAATRMMEEALAVPIVPPSSADMEHTESDAADGGPPVSNTAPDSCGTGFETGTRSRGWMGGVVPCPPPRNGEAGHRGLGVNRAPG